MTKFEALDVMSKRYEAMRLALLALPDEADIISIPPFISASEFSGVGHIKISGSRVLPSGGIETGRYNQFIEHATYLYGVPVIWLTKEGCSMGLYKYRNEWLPAQPLEPPDCWGEDVPELDEPEYDRAEDEMNGKFNRR